MSEKLKPCPFCGSQVSMLKRFFGVGTVFECETCKTRFIFPWDKDPEEWNRRADDDDAGN